VSELSEEARALIAREAPLDEPTPSELERGRLQVFAALGLPVPVAPPPPPSQVPAPPATALKPMASAVGLPVKLVAISFAVGSVVAGVAFRAPPEPAVAPSTPVVHVAPPPEPEVVPEVTVVPAPVVPSAPAPVPTPRTPSPRPPDDALATESMLVAAAEAQLRAGHASEALSLFDRYLREHPGGALRHESLAGRIAALCRLGRFDAGRTELERFATRFPRSPSLPRLRTACNVEP
jgi:hypothetical protein